MPPTRWTTESTGVGTSIDALVEQALGRVGFPKVNTLNDLMERLTELSKTLETKIRTTFKA